MYVYGSSAIPAQDPPSLVPIGFSNNNLLTLGNTFYWSKLAWARYPGDYSKAHIMKWRALGTYKLGDMLAGRRRRRTGWYGTSTQGATSNSIGTSGRAPAKVCRVLDDGTSQITSYEYSTGR
jgi:hypothetical protein